MTPLSVLDLSPIVQGADASQSLANSLDLARHAERLGYHRYWLAEHHNMPGIASAATSVVVGHVAAGTKTIRVGAGGIMLPNHAPLVIAEQFGTLAALFPGRIDLGLGRAPGTDQMTARALRRTLAGNVDDFPRDVLELIGYFRAAEPNQPVRAVPGAGLEVPVWILGSSLYGAQLAAALGLPYAFASHFAPADLDHAAMIYRTQFRPSDKLAEPYFMAATSVFAAETDAAAQLLFSSQQQAFVNLRTGRAGPLPPPVEGFYERLDAQPRAMLDHALSCAVVGGPEAVKAGLQAFRERTKADELIITAQIFDHAARVRSFEIAMEAWTSPCLDAGALRDHNRSMDEGLQIGDVRVAGRVLAAPMTGVTDLPFRRLASRLGAPYVATEMVACAEFAKGRPDVVRRAAVGEGLPLMVVQLVGRDPAMIAKGARLAADAGAEIVDLNMGCPAKEVTGAASGSALMRDLDLAETLIRAAVDATPRPVTLKMRLGWDDASKNAPELAWRAQRAGIKAVAVHARTRCQFYTGKADWKAVAAVRAETTLPLAVNGDIADAATARQALAQSGADAVMVGRGVYGRPWLLGRLNAALAGGGEVEEPDLDARLAIVLEHMAQSVGFYGERLGLRIFRKHLGWYVEGAPYPLSADARRAAKGALCRLETAREVEAALVALWTPALARAA